MFKNLIYKRPAVFWGTFLLILMLFLAACAATGPAPENQEPAETKTEATTETEESSDTAEPAASETESADETDMIEPAEESEPQEEVAVASGPATCEPVIIPENEQISPPTEDDWSQGPETAAVTIIEYGDFQ